MVMNLYLAAPPSGIDVTERGDNRVEQQTASCDVGEGYLGETGQSAAGIDQCNLLGLWNPNPIVNLHAFS